MKRLKTKVRGRKTSDERPGFERRAGKFLIYPPPSSKITHLPDIQLLSSDVTLSINAEYYA